MAEAVTGDEWRGIFNAAWASMLVLTLFLTLLATGLLPFWATLPCCFFCGLVVGLAARDWKWRPWK